MMKLKIKNTFTKRLRKKIRTRQEEIKHDKLKLKD
jgi:hypothetical protein